MVHLAFGSLVVRALMEKPTVFLVSRSRKMKLGSCYWSEGRNPGRKRKGTEKGSLNFVSPHLRLTSEPCMYEQNKAAQLKINYLNKDQSCCPKKQSLQLKPSQENCLLKQKKHDLEKNNRNQNLYNSILIMCVIHSKIIWHMKKQENGAHSQERREWTMSDPEMNQLLKLTDKNVTTAILTILDKVKQNMFWMNENRKTQQRYLVKKKIQVEIIELIIISEIF